MKGNIKVKIGLYLLSTVVLMNMLQSLMVSGIAESFPEKSLTSIQMISSIAQLAGILSGFMGGFLASKFNRKTITITALAVTCGATTLAFFMADQFVILYLASFCIGFGLKTGNSMLSAMISSQYAGEERVTAVGIQSACMNLGSSFFSLIGGYMLALGWKYVYLIFLVIIPVVAIGYALVPKAAVELETDSTVPSERKDKKVKILNPYMYCKLAETFIFGIAAMTFMVNLTLGLQEKGMPVTQSGILTSIFQAVMVIGGFVLAWFVRIFKKNASWACYMFMALSLIIFAFGNNLFICVIAMFFRAIGHGCYMTTSMSEIPDHVEREAITAGISNFMAFLSLGMFISPYVITVPVARYLDGTASTRFIVSGMLLIVTGVIFKMIFNRIYKGEENAKVAA